METSSGDPLTQERALLEAYAGGGDPVVIEETYPLAATAEVVRNFILQSRPYATGWLGDWGDLTMSQVRADPARSTWLAYFWGRLFQQLSGNLYGPFPRSDRIDNAPADQGTAAQGAASQGRAASAGGPGAIADRARPVIRSLRVTPRRFAVDRRGPLAARRRARRGTTIRYRLSETATVVLTIERRSLGRRAGARCRKATRKRRGARPCARYRRVGAFRDRGREGQNRIRFSARLTRRRSLRPGRYRVVARAIDSAANRSRRARAGFRVVRRR